MRLDILKRLWLVPLVSVASHAQAQSAPPPPSLLSSAVTGVTQISGANNVSILSFDITLTFRNNSPGDGDFQLTTNTFTPLPFGGFIGGSTTETLTGSAESLVTVPKVFSRSPNSASYVSYEVRARNSFGSSSPAVVTIKPPGGAVGYLPYSSLSGLSDAPGTIAVAIGDNVPDEDGAEIFVLNSSEQVIQQLLLNRDFVRPSVIGLQAGTYTIYARTLKQGISVAYKSTTVTVPEGAPVPTATVEAPAPSPTAVPPPTPFVALIPVPKPSVSIAKGSRSLTVACRLPEPTSVSVVVINTKAPGKEKRVTTKVARVTPDGTRVYVATIKGLKPGTYRTLCETKGAAGSARGPETSVRIK